MRRSSVLSAFFACAAAMLAACSSTPVKPEPGPSTSTAATTTAAAPSPSAGTPAPAQAAAIAAHLDPNSPVYRNRSLYFAYDEAALRPEDRPVVEIQGPYLSRHPALHVRIEGNTDERGGSEYNLALGQRRAEAVKRALQVYGVKEAQVETVSFGKERPKADGHDEAAWAQNRRADIVYLSR